MDIIPAIDIKQGKCVRLYQGDFEKEEVFSTDPAKIALSWEQSGATRLHVIDLDGANEGKLVNLSYIEKIASLTRIPIQVGGGIRDYESVEQLLSIGVQRVILGTTAITYKNTVKEIVNKFGPQKVILGVDARDGLVASDGWKKQSDIGVLDLITEMEAHGISRLIFTDIHRDGTLAGPNLDAIREVAEGTNMSVIASGGISTIDHIKSLNSLDIEAAIVGRALYTGSISLQNAMQAIS